MSEIQNQDQHTHMVVRFTVKGNNRDDSILDIFFIIIIILFVFTIDKTPQIYVGGYIVGIKIWDTYHR